MKSAAIALVIQDVSDFSFGPATGSSTSQTITAGQAATFDLTLEASASFTGIVNLSCAIAPILSAAPTCSVPSSVQVSGSGSQSVRVRVGTTAPVVTSALPLGSPSASSRLPGILVLLGTVLLCSLSRKRISLLANAMLVMTVVGLAACGGGNEGRRSFQGTPAGTDTIKITASSGTLSHSETLALVVQ